MVSVIYILMLDVSHAIEVLVLCLLVVGVKFHTAVAFLIRAKRVSNCYMREKKVCVCVCMFGKSPKHGIPLPVYIHSF